MVPTSLKLLKSHQGSNHLPHETRDSNEGKWPVFSFHESDTLDQLHNLWSPVQNENVRLLVQNVLRIPRQQHRALNQVWDPSEPMYRLHTHEARLADALNFLLHLFIFLLSHLFMTLAPNTWQKVFLLPLIFALNLLCILESKYLDRNLDSTPTGLYTHRNDAPLSLIPFSHLKIEDNDNNSNLIDLL